MIDRRTKVAVEQCVAFAVVAMVGMIATYVVTVRTRRGQALELIASNGRLVQTSKIRGAAGLLLQTISVGSLALALLVLLVVALRRGDRVVAAVAAAVVTGSVVSTEVLKHFVFHRPFLLDNTVNSYPSGHSAVAFSVVIAAVLVQSPPRRITAAVIGVPYALAIGTSTVLAGWHRPSDVFGAWLVVAAWAFAGVAVLHLMSPPGDRAASRPPLLGLAAVLVLFVVTLGSVTLVGLGERIRDVRVGRRVDAAKRAVAFGASMSSIALAAIVVTALVLYLLRAPAPSAEHSVDQTS
jgi:membrane-associated phospholipid phosphatase